MDTRGQRERMNAQKHQFREFGKIADLRIIGREITRAGNPADVRPPESTDGRRVNVFLIVRMFVVMAMLVTPPKRATLNGGRTHYGKKKLRRTRSVERFMRKIAVIKSGDGEDSRQIQNHCGQHGEPTPADEEEAKTPKMQKNKRQHPEEFNLVRLGVNRRQIAISIISVKPLRQGNEAVTKCCYAVFHIRSIS